MLYRVMPCHLGGRLSALPVVLLCFAVCAIHPRPQKLFGPELCLAGGADSSSPAREGEQPDLESVRHR